MKYFMFLTKKYPILSKLRTEGIAVHLLENENKCLWTPVEQHSLSFQIPGQLVSESTDS